MDETTAGLGVLWEHSGAALLTPLLWGAGITVLTFVGLLILWFVARSKGWLNTSGDASGAAWPRRVTLGVWIVLLVPASGTAGLIYGAQRATIGVLEETQVIQRSCGAIAVGMILAAAEQAEGADRIPVANLRALWTDANARVDRVKDEQVRTMIDSRLEEGTTADAASVVGRWGLDALQRDLIGGQTEMLEELLTELEARAAPDGTIGVEEAGGWLSDRYVMPTVNAFIVGLFRPYYAMLWLIVAVGIAVPFVATGVSRRRKAKAHPVATSMQAGTDALVPSTALPTSTISRSQ